MKKWYRLLFLGITTVYLSANAAGGKTGTFFFKENLVITEFFPGLSIQDRNTIDDLYKRLKYVDALRSGVVGYFENETLPIVYHISCISKSDIEQQFNNNNYPERKPLEKIRTLFNSKSNDPVSITMRRIIGTILDSMHLSEK